MIVGIQSGGIGKVDMSQTGGTTDKSKSKDKASGTFEDLMNLAATNPNTTTQTADSAMSHRPHSEAFSAYSKVIPLLNRRFLLPVVLRFALLFLHR